MGNKSKKMKTIEQAAMNAVNSILLIIIGISLASFNNQSPKSYIEPKVLSAQNDNCDGIKLNYPRVIKEWINGRTVEFRYNCVRKDFLASSYDGNCKGCSGRTRLTGEPVRWGICAVDTDVIPPKSTFYIPGYGPCKAADTGSAVKGRRIDLGFKPTTHKWWSKRYTDIYTFVERR